MEVVVYLISASYTSLEAKNQSRPNRIFFGGRYTDEGDEEHLRRFSVALTESSSSVHAESSPDAIDALRKRLPFTWYNDDRFDTANPFGDRRQLQYHAMWTFDSRSSTLRHTNAEGCREISFARLHALPVSLADMQLIGGPLPVLPVPALETNVFPWKPQVEVDDGIRAFIHRILCDFHHQWRHIFRNEYNLLTIRRFARAIIRLSTLDFGIRENTGGHHKRGVHVWILDLPSWEPYETDILLIGNCWVVLCEDILDGLSIAQRHADSPEIRRTRNSSVAEQDEAQAHYMVLSVRYIMLCHVNDLDSFRYTAPELLFHGDSSRPLSTLALDYLIWTTVSARPIVNTPIQKLPIEIQDMVLSNVSKGTVAAAKVGCELGLGSPFLWKHGTLTNVLQVRYLNRPSGSSVESEIYFGEVKSGVVYWAR